MTTTTTDTDGGTTGAHLETDEELVAAVQAAAEGDTRIFERLLARHQSAVLTNCRYLTGSSEDAEDLSQEVFVKAFFKIGSFEGRSTFKTWVQRIKVNHCLNFLEKTSRRRSVSLDDAEVAAPERMRLEPIAGETLIRNEETARVHTVLESMPDQTRIPLVLRDFDHLSYQDVAGTLGISLSAAKMRIKRAREEFRALYEGTEMAGRAL